MVGSAYFGIAYFAPAYFGGAGAVAALTHDGSLASLVEAWIVGRIAQIPEFAEGQVEPFKGTNSPDGRELIAEMTANRSPLGVVLFEGDRAIATQEGQQDYEPTYAAYIVVQNARTGGASRRGDGQTPGTNLMRDRLRSVLHDVEVSIAANGFWAGRAEFRGVRVVFQRADAFIMRAEIVVREEPLAA